MESRTDARATVVIAALLIAALLAGCSTAEHQARTVEPADASPTGSVGAAAAKGGGLSAVATVQAWVDARNRQRASRGRWTVDAARVTRQGARSATVSARITAAAQGPARRRLDVEFEVARIAGVSTVTKIVVVP